MEDFLEWLELMRDEERRDRVTLLELLPFATQERFVVKWQWEAGDCVVWDNRCTMHCATGFDWQAHTREMWRTTIVSDFQE